MINFYTKGSQEVLKEHRMEHFSIDLKLGVQNSEICRKTPEKIFSKVYKIDLLGGRY